MSAPVIRGNPRYPTNAVLLCLIREAPAARQALGAMLTASVRRLPDAEREAFDQVAARLQVIATAIEALPPPFLAAEPGLPWAELKRLPALLSRPDFAPDVRVLRRTLDRPLRDIKNAAHRLISHQAYLLGTTAQPPGPR